jgi:DDE_Tnp_1-associated
MQTAELGPSLLRALAAVPDPRSRHGCRHPLPAVLALATVAMRCGARSLYAIAQWGREHPEAVVRTLGFPRQPTPGVATLHRVFKRRAAEAFETVLAQWAQWAPAAWSGRGKAIAIDGTALRGIHGEQVPGVRLVAADDVQTGLVLAHTGGEGHNRPSSAGGGGSGGRGGRGAGAGGTAPGP